MDTGATKLTILVSLVSKSAQHALAILLMNATLVHKLVGWTIIYNLEQQFALLNALMENTKISQRTPVRDVPLTAPPAICPQLTVLLAPMLTLLTLFTYIKSNVSLFALQEPGIMILWSLITSAQPVMNIVKLVPVKIIMLVLFVETSRMTVETFSKPIKTGTQQHATLNVQMDSLFLIFPQIFVFLVMVVAFFARVNQLIALNVISLTSCTRMKIFALPPAPSAITMIIL